MDYESSNLGCSVALQQQLINKNLMFLLLLLLLDIDNPAWRKLWGQVG